MKNLFLHPTIRLLVEAMAAFESNETEASPLDGVTPSASHVPAPEHAAFLRIEPRSLLALFAVGDIAPLDAAAIGYLPHAQFRSGQRVLDWFDGLPVCTHVLDTFLGRTAIICLPCFDAGLYRDDTKLLDRIMQALKMSKHLGARVVSLTGLIPSATDYGRALEAFTHAQRNVPAITTGHATTAAAVVLNIKHMLTKSSRDLTQERVGILGVGSIGRTTVHLLLACLPHPLEILLCDIYSKVSELERMAHHLKVHCGFQGPVRMLHSHAQVPSEFYEATMIIGATNVPDVLDVPRLNPGTVIIDDSGPHCFDATLAIQRFKEHEDILFSEGGVLQSPEPIHEIRYMPQEVTQRADLWELKRFLNVERRDPFTITGCVLSGVLSSRFDKIGPTVGSIEVETCVRHYEKLNQLGFQAAELHCEDYILPDDAVRNFRRHFGTSEKISLTGRRDHG